MAERVWAHPRHITPAIPPRGRRETLSLGAGYAYQVSRRIPKVPDRHVTPFAAMRVKDDSRAQSLCGLERAGHLIYADIEDGVSGESFTATAPASGSAPADFGADERVLGLFGNGGRDRDSHWRVPPEQFGIELARTGRIGTDEFEVHHRVRHISNFHLT